MSDTKDLKKGILDAAEIGVQELIKVLEEPIIDFDLGPLGKPDPEKMKAAAQAKRVAFEDALAILDRLQEERNMLDDSSEISENVKDGTPFAERYSNKSDRR